MGASVYYYDIDLNKNKLLNARLHPVTTGERTVLGSGYNSADKGIVVYDTTENTFYGWDGNTWQSIGLNSTQIAEIASAYNATITGAELSSSTEDLMLMFTRRDGTTLYDSLKIKHIHQQTVASAEWTITHNLNCYPPVTIVDVTNTEVIGDIEYINTSSLKVKFSAGFSGTAYIN